MIVYLYQKFAGKATQGMGLIFKVDIMRRIKSPKVNSTCDCNHMADPPFRGSAGREGVAVQLGATVSHAFSRYFKLPNASRIFLTMGWQLVLEGSSKHQSVATFFALEVLTLGQLSLPILVPTLIASFVASTTSHLLGLEKFSHFVSESLTIDLETFMKLALLGLAFGLQEISLLISCH
ncbi:MAG: chloride channel protein [Streptococcus salivarius]